MIPVPWTPDEERAERAYIAEYVSDPRLRRWLATIDAERARYAALAEVARAFRESARGIDAKEWPELEALRTALDGGF